MPMKADSENLDGLGLRSLLSLCRNVGDALVFFQCLESGADDFGVVSKEVLAAGFGRDEAETFFAIEPFYDTSLCLHFLQSLNLKTGMKPKVSKIVKIWRYEQKSTACKHWY